MKKKAGNHRKIKKTFLYLTSFVLFGLILLIGYYSSFPLMHDGGEAEILQEAEEHVVTKDGLHLEAKISEGDLHQGETVQIETSITNVSGETIVYNDRCSDAFSVNVEAEFASLHLTSGNSTKLTVCEAIFDPADLRNLEPNESLTKEVTYVPEVRINNNEFVDAPAGDYSIFFRFQMEERDQFVSNFPLTVINEEPSIITVQEAKAIAKVNPKVSDWFDEYNHEKYTIDEHMAFLSEGKWYILFWVYENNIPHEQIVVAIDLSSHIVTSVNEQSLGGIP